jgi:hypothetical protein
MVKENKLVIHDIVNDSQYRAIVEEINGFYEEGNPFWLLIETRQVKKIHMPYLYKFGGFLRSLRSRTPSLLCYSVINVYDDLIYNMLYTLFTFLSKPTAKVTVFYYEGGYDCATPNEERNIKKITNYFP